MVDEFQKLQELDRYIYIEFNETGVNKTLTIYYKALALENEESASRLNCAQPWDVILCGLELQWSILINAGVSATFW
jgi:hypothetical protein